MRLRLIQIWHTAEDKPRWFAGVDSDGNAELSTKMCDSMLFYGGNTAGLMSKITESGCVKSEEIWVKWPTFTVPRRRKKKAAKTKSTKAVAKNK